MHVPFLLLVVICNSIIVNATEVDHFTPRKEAGFKVIGNTNGSSTEVQKTPISFYQLAEDMHGSLNEITNRLLDAAVKNANIQAGRSSAELNDPSCSKDNLFQNIHTAMIGDRYIKSNIETEFEESAHFPTRSYQSSRKSSIYRAFTAEDGGLYGSKREGQVCCSNLFRVGSTFLSGDKLDHFFNVGHDYYRTAGNQSDIEKPAKHEWPVQKVKNFDSIFGVLSEGIVFRSRIAFRAGGTLKDALEYGMSTEKGLFGLTSNGILSYADLSANYQGLRFYQEAVNGPNPLFKCESGNWVRTERKFDWADYVDDSWDESINCNEYGHPITAEKVQQAITKLGFTSCPAEPGKCEALALKHQKVESYVLHPTCRSKAKSEPTAGSPAEAQPAAGSDGQK